MNEIKSAIICSIIILILILILITIQNFNIIIPRFDIVGVVFVLGSTVLGILTRQLVLLNKGERKK